MKNKFGREWTGPKFPIQWFGEDRLPLAVEVGSKFSKAINVILFLHQLLWQNRAEYC